MITGNDNRFSDNVTPDHITLIHITTVPETFGFFRGQIKFMKEKGFEVHAVSSPGKLLQETSRRENIAVHGIEMARQITPVSDLSSILKLFQLFKRLKPTIVHAHTPKGGLLGVIAARLAAVPVVFYGMRGLPFVTQAGFKRKILLSTESISCRLADQVIPVSAATKAKAVAAHICPAEKILVPGNGSSNGVDAEGRFNPANLSSETRAIIRKSYGIPLEATVVGFVGRLVRDKGIIELAEAWENLSHEHLNLYLLLIGPLEPQDPIPSTVLEKLQGDPMVKFTGPVEDPAAYYAAMDILTLPTYREGFPNTPLEAAAMKLPVIITDVDGCPEAVEDGVTGIVVPPQDSSALSEAINKLFQNSQLRKTMGQAGRDRVLKRFKPIIIWEALYENYLKLLKENHMIN
jgi:glycosyltransferase involved in cell wall biosynthesis